MDATLNLGRATKTDQFAQGEFGPKLPIYTGGRPDDRDNRVCLADGTKCYVWYDRSGGEPLPILCTHLVALDAGDNVVREFCAADRQSIGISAPVIPRTAVTLFAAPKDGTVVGYYREQ